jgi:ankyrin repeat protein
MSQTLPERPHLDWYRKAAKAKLAEIRRDRPAARLAEAQLAVAREHGFSSWRKLKDAVDAAQTAQFFEAIRHHDVERVRGLLEDRAGLASTKTPAGQTPLHVAAEANSGAIVELLLAHGADPVTRYGSSAHTALSWAVTTSAFAAAEALVRGGVEPDLFSAAGMGAVPIVKSFFDEEGALRPGASQTGSSRFAADGQRLPAPPSDPREIVSDALCFASRNGQSAVVRFLLTRRPILDFRGFIGGTALHWAYYGASRAVIAMLLEAGADPTLRDAEYRCTPRAFGICVAASWGLPRLVERSLQLDGSLVNVLDGRGTPLHEAARAGEVVIARMLLDAGAEPGVRDGDGQTPLDLAERQKHDAVADLLRAIAPGP